MTRKFEKISFGQFKKDVNCLCQNDSNNVYKSIQLPQRATAKSAGYDFYTPVGFKLAPNKTIKIPIGVKAYMEDDEVLKIHPRSSLGFKYHLRLSNSTGIIDSDYVDNPDNEGHIWIKLRNEGDETVTIQPNEAIAQGIFHKYLITNDDSFDGEKREGGIGSTND
ncbi:MAG: deoxyuridine 5'-triphosphate nucleotidohydrolase [Halanaerobium sp.]